MTSYIALIKCQNDETGMTYFPGDVVMEGDFSEEVIQNWLTITPPVLMEMDWEEEEE